jgi:SAM-dependent methyltransferase
MKETYWQKIAHIVGPARIEEFDQIGQKETRNAIEQFILAHSDMNTKLLDAGCNTGVEGWRLFKKNYPGFYLGIDSNIKALTYALENLWGFHAAVACADIKSISYPDMHFDIVLSKDVIEHARYYDSVLAELSRLTKRWLILSMFIKMHDQPDLIHLEPQGFYHNRYQRQKLYTFMADGGLANIKTIFQSAEDEVLVFERGPTESTI